MKKTLLVIGIMVAACSMAQAKNSGFYIGAQAGAGLLSAGSFSKEYEGSVKDENGDEIQHLATAKGNSKNSSISEFSGVGAINLGYDFQPAYNVPVRAELSYTARTNVVGDPQGNMEIKPDPTEPKTKMKASMNTLLVNGYYDFYTNSNFIPYITGGVGIAFRTFNTDITLTGDESETQLFNTSTSDLNFAWRVGAGIAYQITENWVADFSASYVDAGTVKSSNTESQKIDKLTIDKSTKASAALSSIDFLLGIRYSF